MRLLKTTDCEVTGWQPQLIDFRGEPYAILSHRWLENANDEVLFSDIHVVDDGGLLGTETPNDPQRNTKYQYNPGFSNRLTDLLPGYDKLKGAAQMALQEGYSYIWVDTCCIDKSSSSELSEAINSMYKWYLNSGTCFVYMADVQDSTETRPTSLVSDFAKSSWWFRGWTLQELVAPAVVNFYTKSWTYIGEKKTLSHDINEISGIGIDVLTQSRKMNQVSVARRMSWASLRETTREEDLAYSLMGIFDVNMPLLYGEGKKAFLRLQEEIMKSSDDESIFAWVDPAAPDEERRGLLAENPSYFNRSGSIIPYEDFEDREPYVMSNRGLSITLHLSRTEDHKIAAALHCPVVRTGDGFIAVFLQRLGQNSQHFARVKCSRLGSLQSRGTLETIYIRQNHDTHRLDRVLPYHYFNMRNLTIGPEADEQYTFMDVVHADPHWQGKSSTIFSTSRSQQWLRGYRGSYLVMRGDHKLSVVLLFGKVKVTSTPKNAKLPLVGCIAVMLGSTSTTEVSFDAHEMDHLESFEDMAHMFRPWTAGQWKELENFRVKVDLEPQVSGDTQLFLTDITITPFTNTSPLDVVADTLTHYVEPFVPRLRGSNSEGGKSRWKWLVRNS